MIRINNYQGRIIGIKIPNEVAGNLIHDLKDLDLTGVTDGTAGKNTEKKTNTGAEDEPNGESGDTVMGGKSGTESDKESVNDHYGSVEIESEREIEDVSVTGEMGKKPDTEPHNESVEENMEKGSDSESDYKSVNRYIASLRDTIYPLTDS